MPPSESLQYSYTESLLLIQDAGYETDYAEKAQAADFETAIHFAKYGKFQYALLIICGIVYATCAISTTTLSFVLPSAECDFDLSSLDKGKLSAMPLIGMIFGCTIWGTVADAYGRKIAILLSLLIDFIASLTSSLAQTFNLFLICRFFNGFGIIGATSIIFTFLGEFLSKKHTDKMLGKLEIFWNIGVVLLPGVAWALLRKPSLDTFPDYGNFSPWRIFVLSCGLPSLLSLVIMYFVPETPKYLLSKGRYEEARQVFQQIFTINTGQSQLYYPVLSLDGEFQNNNNLEESLKTWKNKIRKGCSKLSQNIRTFCDNNYMKYLGIACFADFGLMASYYTLIMWFPEIFERFNQFQEENPGGTASICSMSAITNTTNEPIYDFTPCDPTIANTVFIETGIIGLSCFPTSISLSYFMEKFGKKIVLVISLLLSGIATVSLIWVQSNTQTLIISCIFEALTSILEAVLFCVVVDLFPTNIRAIAVSLTATSGRIGAIFGNVLFGLLFDINCVIPIYFFGFMLIGSGLLCICFPKTDQYITLH